MGLTVRQRIEEQAGGLVGRESERAVLHLLLGDEGPLVVFVHGVSGASVWGRIGGIRRRSLMTSSCMGGAQRRR